MDTNGGLNDQPDAPLFADGDYAYGGAGLDVLMANTGNDRLFDWTGEFNSFIVPFSPFGAPTVNRLLSPAAKAFIADLGRQEGADATLFEPNGELGLVDQDDPDWNDQHGGPRDPQPGNIGGVKRDTQGAPEDMANPPDCGCDCVVPVTAGVQIVKAVNGMDANAGTGPELVVGSTLTWTYQVRNTSGETLSILSLVDDAGTTDTTDDFAPTAVTVTVGADHYNVGDGNRDNWLDAGETWLYTATGTVIAGAYVNVATVTAQGQGGETYTDTDPARYFGIGAPPAAIRIETAINAADPTSPTPVEDADNAPGRTLLVGTPITWTYQVFNEGDAPIQISAISDDFGTSTSADDFAPAPVLGRWLQPRRHQSERAVGCGRGLALHLRRDLGRRLPGRGWGVPEPRHRHRHGERLRCGGAGRRPSQLLRDRRRLGGQRAIGEGGQCRRPQCAHGS